MRYRTDLAVEVDSILRNSRQQAGGYIRKQSQVDGDISVTEIIITTEEGAAAFGKPKGVYTTIEVAGVLEQKDGIKERAAKTLAEELKKHIKFDYFLKALVVGLAMKK